MDQISCELKLSSLQIKQIKKMSFKTSTDHPFLDHEMEMLGSFNSHEI